MIYEIAVRAQRVDAFRHAFSEVLALLRRAKGYRGHVLAQGIERRDVFNLIVRWRSLQDHAPGFEASDDHAVFMAGIQEYFSEEPTVYHLEGEALAVSDDDPLDPTV